MAIRSQGKTKSSASKQVAADDDELMRRALAAYFRTGGTDQPSASISGVETLEKKDYVVLRSGRGVLAVYRIRNDGMLKRLRRWPADLAEY